MSRSIRLLLVIGVALFAMAAFVACDDGDGDGDDPDPTEAGDAPGDEGDDGEAEDGDDGAGTGDLAEELRNTAGQFGQREAKITLEFSSSTGDSGSFTLYWKPDVGWRFDSSAEGAEGSFISTGDVFYICTSENGDGTCLETPTAGAASALPFLGAFITDPGALAAEIDTTFGGVDIDRSERTIAGRNAICYSTSGEVEGESGGGEYCFDENGLLLFVSAFASGPDGGDFTMEATEVEDSVSDGDLEPPYPVQELPEIPGFE